MHHSFKQKALSINYLLTQECEVSKNICWVYIYIYINNLTIFSKHDFLHW